MWENDAVVAPPAGQVSAEVVATPQPGTTPLGHEQYFIELNATRWAYLLDAEARFGQAYADSDPLKLYYNLSHAHIGELSEAVLVENWRLARQALAQQRLGFADHVIFLSARPATLQERNVGDVSRRRGRFALHLRLAPAWATYYAALEAVRLLALIEATLAPGSGGTPLHINTLEDENYYVTAGTLTFRLREHTVEAPAGSFVHTPRGVVHTHWNASAAPVTVLGFPTPSGFERFFAEIAEVMARMPAGAPDMRRIAALYETYGLQIVGPPPHVER